MRRGCRALGLLLLLTFALACQTHSSINDPSAEAPRRGGTLVLGSISDVDSWNEYLSRQTFSNDLARRIWLRLATPRGEAREHPPDYEPGLAESWDTSADGKTLTFHLRDAVWSDGKPVTADDVRFTWTAQVSPDVAWVGADGKTHITDVKAIDGRTVAFSFDRAYPDAFADAVDGGILPAHVYASVPFTAWRTYDWSKATVGSGPFLLEHHKPAEEIALVRNPRYFKIDLPRLDRIVVRVVPDIANLVTQLRSGALDYMEGIPPREAQLVRETKGLTLLPFDEPKYDYIGWNAARTPFDDPRVRRALTLAIDREALVDDLLFGFGRISKGPVLSFWWGADPELAAWPYDPGEAKRLLADAGFTPGSDGVLVRGGKPLAFELTTNAGNRLRESMLVKIQEQLSRIGVRASTRSIEMKTFVAKNSSGEFDAYVGGWRFNGKLDLRSIFHSDARAGRGNNVVSYASPVVDALLDDLDHAPGWKAMIPPLREIQRAIHDDAPYTFLYETRRIAAAGARTRGVTIDVPSDPLGRLETWWLAP